MEKDLTSFELLHSEQEKENYVRPKILSHQVISFETLQSGGGGSFPGLGWGVGGVPANQRGDFPGGGSTGGEFPGTGPQHNHRP